MLIPLLFISLLGNSTILIMAGRSCCGNKKPSVRYSKQAQIKSQAAAVEPQQTQVHEITSPSDYQKKISEHELVVVKFYSNQCPHCIAMKPVFVEIAEKNPDVVFLKLDVDNPALSSIADKHNVESIPTFVFFRNGSLVDTKIGTYKSGSFDKLIKDFKNKTPKQPAPKVEKAQKPQPVTKPEEKKKPAAPKPEVSGALNQITTLAQFNQIINSGKPVIIDFYTDWCGACKLYEPTLETIAKEYAGKVDIYKVNAEIPELQAKAKQYTKGYPTTIYIVDGVVKDTTVGTRTEKMLRQSADKLLGKKK